MAVFRSRTRKKIICRDDQLLTLENLISSPWEVFPPMLLLVGHVDTGKTITLEDVISRMKWEYRIARTDCSSYISIQLLLTSILDQIVCHKVRAECGYKPFCRVDSTFAFVRELKKAAHNRARKTFRYKKIFIVLDNGDDLANLNPTLPNFFSRLQELTSLRITVLMMVKKSPRTNWFSTQPITIHFPQYTKEEMAMIICSERPERFNKDCEEYDCYVKMMVDLMYREWRVLGELRRQVHENEDAVMTGDLDVRSMWARVLIAMKSSQPVTSDKALSPVNFNPSTMGQSSFHLFCGKEADLCLDLPYCAKFLVIAALLAAHIPPACDTKIFVKECVDGKGRKRRRRKTAPASRIGLRPLGPCSFPIDRLYAIFYAITEEYFPLTVPLQSQVSSLIKLELIRNLSVDSLSEQKLTVSASIDVVSSLARSVDFDLEKYLSLVV